MAEIQRRAVGLVRVSSEEQVKGGYGLEYQEQDIRAFCARQGFDLISVFRDDGYSGASVERPGFQEMISWARTRRFDVLVVWKLDRLFRDTRLTLQTVDELSSLSIEFRSVQESFTHDSNGRFLLTIFAAGAEKERKDISLRMTAGRVAAAKKGTWISGAGMPPFGYQYNSETKQLDVDEDEALVVRQLFQWLVLEKLSLYKIQCRVNERHIPTKFDRMGRTKTSGSRNWWAKRTIGRILANEIYTGSFTFRKYRRCGSKQDEKNWRPSNDWITVSVPRIVSDSLFNRAQQQLQENAARSARRTNTLYLLQKLLVCGHDGRRMQAAKRPADHWRECKYYFCSGQRKAVTPNRCPSHSISESRIVPPVWDKITELLLNPTLVLTELARYQRSKTAHIGIDNELEALEARKCKVTEKGKRLVELYLMEAIEKTRLQAEQRRLKDELSEIDREVTKLEGLITTQDELTAKARTLEALYANYGNRFQQATDQVKREILTTFVRSIVVRGEELEIEVKLPSSDSFEGQRLQPLTRKDTPIFLATRLLSLNHICKNRRLSQNLGRYAQRKDNLAA